MITKTQKAAVLTASLVLLGIIGSSGAAQAEEGSLTERLAALKAVQGKIETVSISDVEIPVTTLARAEPMVSVAEELRSAMPGVYSCAAHKEARESVRVRVILQVSEEGSVTVDHVQSSRSGGRDFLKCVLARLESLQVENKAPQPTKIAWTLDFAGASHVAF
ncbi:MAG: hypothetical protein V1798_05060 [Pseudomonadota bacterium]